MQELNNGWISIEDKLPSKDGNYLCSLKAYNDSTKNTVDIVKFANGRFTGVNIFFDVTHWQNLPEPPKEIK